MSKDDAAALPRWELLPTPTIELGEWPDPAFGVMPRRGSGTQVVAMKVRHAKRLGSTEQIAEAVAWRYLDEARWDDVGCGR